jgi:hypothetical protein
VLGLFQFSSSMRKSFLRSWYLISQSLNPLHFIQHNVHYRVHKSPPQVLIPSQMNPVHAIQPHFQNNRLNIILPSMLRFSEWSFPSTFSDQRRISPLLHVHLSFHLMLLDFNIIIIFEAQAYNLCRLSICILGPRVTASPELQALFSAPCSQTAPTLGLPSGRERSRFTPYKTADNIIDLCV